MGKTLRFFAAATVAGIVAGITGFALYSYYGPNSGETTTTDRTVAASTRAPVDIRFTDLQGNTHKLADWHGKLLLVNFWATWCAPCRAEIPNLVKAQKRFGPQGFQVIGPAVDDPDAVRAKLSVLGIDYPVMTGTPDSMVQTMDELGNAPGALPFSVLISRDGHIVARHLGAFSAQQLDRLIVHNLSR